MRVTVRYMAQLRQVAGSAGEQVELDQPSTLVELLQLLAKRHGAPFHDLLLNANGAVNPAILVFVGDEQTGPEQRTLHDGDVVTVLTPMAGG